MNPEFFRRLARSNGHPECRVSLVAYRRRPSSWPWKRYNDILAIVCNDGKVHEYQCNTRPTTARHDPRLRFPPYTVKPGRYVLSFGPSAYRGETLRQAGRMNVTFTDKQWGSINRPWMNGEFHWMLHEGPHSAGCFTMPSWTLARFMKSIRALSEAYGNPVGLTNVENFPGNPRKSDPLIPMVVV